MVISGQLFYGDITVAFGGDVYADGEANSPYTLTVSVPDGAKTGPIVVTTGTTVVTSATSFVVTHPAPTPSPVPVITSATTASGTMDYPFTYQIMADRAVSSYSATIGGLPAGLSFDAASGVISGTPEESGFFQSDIGATDASGTGTAVLELSINTDAPTVTVTASPKKIMAAAGQSTTFVFTLSHPVPHATSISYLAQNINLTLIDYSFSKRHVKIPAGKTSAALTLTPFALSPLPPGLVQKVKLLITNSPGNYIPGNPGSAKIQITVPPR